MDISTLDGKKFLYQGDCPYWKGRAPLLFLFIGRMYKNQYVLDNKT